MQWMRDDYGWGPLEPVMMTSDDGNPQHLIGPPDDGPLPPPLPPDGPWLTIKGSLKFAGIIALIAATLAIVVFLIMMATGLLRSATAHELGQLVDLGRVHVETLFL